jgi:hypothetical protein
MDHWIVSEFLFDTFFVFIIIIIVFIAVVTVSINTSITVFNITTISNTTLISIDTTITVITHPFVPSPTLPPSRPHVHHHHHHHPLPHLSQIYPIIHSITPSPSPLYQTFHPRHFNPETSPITQSDYPVSNPSLPIPTSPRANTPHRQRTHPNRNNHPLTLSNQPLLNRYTISTLYWNFHLHLLP